MAGETETVGLNLEGNFAAKAEQDAAAAGKLEKALSTLEKLQKAQAKRANPMADALVKSEGFGKISTLVGKIFGQGASDKLNGAAASLADSADKLGISPDMLKGAGVVLSGAASATMAAGAVVAAAAAALAAAAGAVIAAGVKFGVEQTDAADVQKQIFAKLGGGGGYKLAVKIAADLGLPEEAAITKTKALLNAKFKENQVESIIKVGIGLDEMQGAGSGDKFAKTLEKIKNSGKFDSKSIKQFAAEGINTADVYASLAKSLGISVDAVKAKVKSGTLDVDKGIAGVLDVASKKFGGVSDVMANSIPGLIAKIKVRFADLFKGFDLTPIKDFLKNVSSVLDSPAGKAFGKAFEKLGNTIIKTLFGPLDGASGKDKMTKAVVFVTAAVNKITAAIVAAKPYIKAAGEFLADLFAPKKGSDGPGAKIREFAAGCASLYKSAKPILSVLLPIVGAGIGIAFKVFATATKVFGAALGFLIAPINGGINAIKRLLAMVGIGAGQASKGGSAIGKGIGAGILKGIAAGAGAALAAAGALAQGMLSRIKSILGIRSPSTAFAFVGAMSAQGMAKGMNDNAQAPAKAAGKMAAGAAAAAGGASGGGAKGGAAAGGGAPVFNITINAAPGMGSAEASKLGAAAVDGAYEAWKKNERRFTRELQEGKAA